MSTEFVWTDELVKEFAQFHIDDFVIKPKWPEDSDTLLKKFKASKKSEDWEIVEYFSGTQNKLIKKVKRLSDNEVFSVGDDVFSVNNRANCGMVTDIKEDKGVDGDALYLVIKNGNWINLDYARKIAEKQKPLFTTEDGVEIERGYKGDLWRVFIVNHSFDIWKPYNLGMPQFINSEEEKYFSTKEAAEEYVIMNKPCLSVEDCRSLYNVFIAERNRSFTDHCKELAKKKI